MNKKIAERLFFVVTGVTSMLTPVNASSLKSRADVRNSSSTVQMVTKGKSEEMVSVKDSGVPKVRRKGRGRSLKENVVIDVEIVNAESGGIVLFPRSKSTLLAVVPKESEKTYWRNVNVSSPVLTGKNVEGIELPAKIKERLINVNSTVRVVKKKTRKSERIWLELIFSLWLMRELIRHIERLEKVEKVLKLRGGYLSSIPGVPGPLLGVANWMIDKATKRLEKSMKEKEEGKTVLEQTGSLTKDLLLNPFLLLGIFLMYVYVKERHPDVHISLPLPTIFPEKKKTWETRGEDLVKLIKRKPVTFIFLVFALYNWRKLYRLVVDKEYRGTVQSLAFELLEKQRQQIENGGKLLLQGYNDLAHLLTSAFKEQLKKTDSESREKSQEIKSLLDKKDNLKDEIHKKELELNTVSIHLNSCVNDLNAYAVAMARCEYENNYLGNANQETSKNARKLIDVVRSVASSETGEKALVDSSLVRTLNTVEETLEKQQDRNFQVPEKAIKAERPGDKYLASGDGKKKR